MVKILANDGIDNAGKSALEAEGYEVLTDKIAQDKLLDEINAQGIEVILVRSATQVRKDIIDGCPKLKMIGRGGVGMDNIDVAYAQERGIDVFNTPASSSQSVAELVFAHFFACARFLHDANRQMPEKGSSDFKALKKSYAKGVELRKKTIGIIGFGRIGQAVASTALGLGMKVMAYDPFLEEAEIGLEVMGVGKIKTVIKTTTLDDLLTNSHFITLHVPGSKGTASLIDAAEVAKMKDGVIIVNAARGGVISEGALLSGLNSGKIAAAGLDVFENEPQPREDLLKHPRISLTPHIGASTNEAQERIGLEIADKIIGFYKK